MAEASPYNPAGMSGSIADAIRRQAARLAQGPVRQELYPPSTLPPVFNMPPVAEPKSPLEQLMEQIQGINVAPTPIEQLRQMAMTQAGGQFDPAIMQLEKEMGRTKQRGEANQKEARSMYGDLATQIAGQLPEITNRMAQASKETESQYDATQQALQNEYSKNAEAQNALYAKLGIQAAAPEASQQAMEDQAYFQQQSKSDEASALQALREMGQSDVAYNQQSSNNTRLAGENVAQDIGSQLENYLQTSGDKLAGLRSSKEAAINALLMQLQQQDQQRISSAEEKEYDRMMDLFNLQLRMQEMQNKSGSGQSGDQLFKGSNQLSGASNYLSGVYGSGNSFTSNEIMKAIQDVIGSKENVAGKYQDPELKDAYGNPVINQVNDAYLQQMLRQRLMEGDLDPNTQAPLGATQFSDFDVNNAINALMAYLGKLR